VQDLREERSAAAAVAGPFDGGKQLGSSGEATDFGLIDRASELALPKKVSEIDDRPRWARHGNPMPDAHIARAEGAGPMHVNAWTRRGAAAADGDVHVAVVRRAQAPHSRRRLVAQDGV
jgi:hypothetical protein